MSATMSNSQHVAVSRFVFAVSAMLFTWLWLDYRHFWLDDAFITFRYSRHLAEGFGPVYNVGERVEGYTSFLWMLIASLPLWLSGVSGFSLWILKGSGLFLGLFTLYRTWSFPGPAGKTVRWLVLLLACNPAFVMNCGDGMETPLFMALLLETARAMQREPSSRSGTWVGLLVAAMVWTRPESLPLLLALPALFHFAYRGNAEVGRDARAAWLRGFLIAGLVPVLAQEAWRWLYYGYPLPNTYYAKATGSQWHRIARGWFDLKFFFVSNIWMQPVSHWLASGLAIVATAQLLRDRSARVLLWFGALWLMVLFRMSFDLWSGSQSMGRHRFLVPLLAPLMVLADEGARKLWRGSGRYIVGLLLLVAMGFNIVGHYAYAKSTRGYRAGLVRGHINLGVWLRENYPRETLMAIGDAGTVPYFSGLATIDLWGLNDGTIAHLPGEYGFKKGTANYTMSRRPELIVLWNKKPFFFKGGRGVAGAKQMDRSLSKHADFKAHYRFVKEFVFREHTQKHAGYYLDVFERKVPGPASRGTRSHAGEPQS